MDPPKQSEWLRGITFTSGEDDTVTSQTYSPLILGSDMKAPGGTPTPQGKSPHHLPTIAVPTTSTKSSPISPTHLSDSTRVPSNLSVHPGTTRVHPDRPAGGFSNMSAIAPPTSTIPKKPLLPSIRVDSPSSESGGEAGKPVPSAPLVEKTSSEEVPTAPPAPPEEVFHSPNVAARVEVFPPPNVAAGEDVASDTDAMDGMMSRQSVQSKITEANEAQSSSRPASAPGHGQESDPHKPAAPAQEPMSYRPTSAPGQEPTSSHAHETGPVSYSLASDPFEDITDEDEAKQTLEMLNLDDVLNDEFREVLAERFRLQTSLDAVKESHLVRTFALYKDLLELEASVGRIYLRLRTNPKAGISRTVRENPPVHIHETIGGPPVPIENFDKQTLDPTEFSNISVQIDDKSPPTFAPIGAGFDKIYLPNETNAGIYKDIEGFVHSMRGGSSIVLMAYGTSGTGKTHTFIGSGTNQTAIVYSALRDLSNHCGGFKMCAIEFMTKINIMEFAGSPVKDITRRPQTFVNQFLPADRNMTYPETVSAITETLLTRLVDDTPLNSVSSRTHVCVCIEPQDLALLSREDSDQGVKPRIFIFDLAGNENMHTAKAGAALGAGKKTGSTSIRGSNSIITKNLAAAVVGERVTTPGVNYDIVATKMLALTGLINLTDSAANHLFGEGDLNTESGVALMARLSQFPTRFYLYAFLSPHYKAWDDKPKLTRDYRELLIGALNQFESQFKGLLKNITHTREEAKTSRKVSPEKAA